MSLSRKVALGLIVGGVIAAKVYVLLRPAGMVSIALGVLLLILSEPTQAAAAYRP